MRNDPTVPYGRRRRRCNVCCARYLVLVALTMAVQLRRRADRPVSGRRTLFGHTLHAGTRVLERSNERPKIDEEISGSQPFESGVHTPASLKSSEPSCNRRAVDMLTET